MAYSGPLFKESFNATISITNDDIDERARKRGPPEGGPPVEYIYKFENFLEHVQYYSSIEQFGNGNNFGEGGVHRICLYYENVHMYTSVCVISSFSISYFSIEVFIIFKRFLLVWSRTWDVM